MSMDPCVRGLECAADTPSVFQPNVCALNGPSNHEEE